MTNERVLVTAEAYERVLEIETDIGIGTAFTIDEGGRQFAVTAKHLFAPTETRPRAALANRFGKTELQLDLIEVSPESADVAVAPLDPPLTPALDLPASAVGLV
jgi:hypothetical protein